jgi:hypothetical protein
MLTALASIMIIVFLGNKPVQQTTMFAITSPERCGWDLSFPPKGMQPAAALQQPEPAHVGGAAHTRTYTRAHAPAYASARACTEDDCFHMPCGHGG